MQQTVPPDNHTLPIAIGKALDQREHLNLAAAQFLAEVDMTETQSETRSPSKCQSLDPIRMKVSANGRIAGSRKGRMASPGWRAREGRLQISTLVSRFTLFIGDLVYRAGYLTSRFNSHVVETAHSAD
jgi:hypothetical protein